MPTFQFDHQTMLTPEEFAQLLRDGDEQYDPVEELLSLERELAQLEQKHRISSAEFYHQYQNGQAGDAVEFVSWAGKYKLYLSLNHRHASTIVEATSPPHLNDVLHEIDQHLYSKTSSGAPN